MMFGLIPSNPAPGPGPMRAQGVNTKHEPYRGVAHSVGAMREAAKLGQAHPEVRAYALGVIHGVQPRDYLSELAAIYYDACRTVRYTRDPAGVEHVSHPAVTIRQKAGDCDDSSVLQRAALGALSVGNDLQYVVVGFEAHATGDNRFTHVFLRVQDPHGKQWLVLDPVAGPQAREMIRRIKHMEAHWA